MGTTLLLMLLSAAAGAGAAAVLYLPTRRSIRELRDAAEAFRQGNWRERAEVEPAALQDVRQLGQLVNDTAEQTHRQLKDLSRQKGDLEALVDSLPDPLVLADTRRKILRLNKPAALLLGVSRERALGGSLEAAVTDPAILAVFDQAAATDAGARREDGEPVLPLRRELRLTRAGKRLAFQAVATRTAAGGVLMVLRDISTLDATLRMKTDFVANAGHELRTPLAAIKAAFETLQEVVGEQAARLDAPGRRAAERCMAIIAGHLQRLEEMLRDLLDLSRAESGELRPTIERMTAGDVARELRQALASAATEKQIDLDLPTSGEPAAVSFVSDRRLLMLALTNLVENGIKYTPGGGAVRLGIDVRAPTGEGAAAGADGQAELVVRVSDTGIGIPPEHVDRIFERFYQVDAARTGTNAMTNPRLSGRGTGLGLSIVKHAAGALGGTVAVESQPGRGSTFTLTLPQRAHLTDESAEPRAM